MRWTIRLCGQFQVERDGQGLDSGVPGRQGRLLFAWLVDHRDRAVARGDLIDLLWPEQPPEASESALSALLSKLRRALGGGTITGRSRLRLTLADEVWVDAEFAESEAVEAGRAAAAEDWTAAADHARAVLETDATDFLPGCDGDWVDERRARLLDVRVSALEVLAESALRLRDIRSAEHAARLAVAVAPGRERAQRLLMEVHEAAGNPAEALRAFEALRAALRAAGATPAAETLAVHERLLRGESLPRNQGLTGALAIPAPLAAPANAMVGRDESLQTLRLAWREAVAGERRVAVVGGDAGIGKTRLAAALACELHSDDVVVLYGRCDEDALAPYQPVTEMARTWWSARGGDIPGHVVQEHATALALLLPELGIDGLEAPGHATRDEPDAARLRLFDAVAGLLNEIAAGHPLLLVFDDLHWADRPTLELVRHVAGSPAPRRALVLGTYRSTELDPAHPLNALLEQEGVAAVSLDGLGSDDVANLVAALGGRTPAPAFVRALHAETDGNPYYVEEVVRHLRDHGRPLDAAALEAAGVPDGVRELLAHRLGRLSETAREALAAAAVIGREFDADLIEYVVPGARADLAEAVAAGLVEEAETHPGELQLTHALVRTVLLDGLSALRRARLHQRAAEALLVRGGDDLSPLLTRLARHFSEAALIGSQVQAAAFCIAAARQADKLLAWEEAAGHYRQALRARELTSHLGPMGELELLLALGTSEDRAGLESARETFATAVRRAREAGDPVRLSRAALGYAGTWGTLGSVNDDVVDLLEEAIEAVGGHAPDVRSRLLARLALELYYGGDPERRLELSAEAVALARETGDARTLAVCLDARHYALWRPENVLERLDVAAELRALAVSVGDPELELEGRGWTIVDLLELGDVARVDIEIEEAAVLSAAVRRPLYEWWTSLFRCTRAQMAGSFAHAERLAQDTLALGMRGQAENAVHYYGQAMFNIRREQGRLDTVLEAVRSFVDTYPAIPAWRAVLALALLDLGQRDEARAEFDAFAAPGFNALPRDANWMIAVTVAAETCAGLGDHARAAELYELLAPYAGRNVVVGRASTCNGSASRLLGMLAAVLENWTAAEAHFADAMTLHEQMAAQPFVARTKVAWAEMLLVRGGDGDRDRAAELATEALLLADGLGMAALAAHAATIAPAGGETVRP